LLVGQPEKVVVEAHVSSTVREVDDHLKSKWGGERDFGRHR
jgi:hypothetical protein